jgi:hypothetical protein
MLKSCSTKKGGKHSEVAADFVHLPFCMCVCEGERSKGELLLSDVADTMTDTDENPPEKRSQRVPCKCVNVCVHKPSEEKHSGDSKERELFSLRGRISARQSDR